MTNIQEVWKSALDYPLYSVSNLGNVKVNSTGILLKIRHVWVTTKKGIKKKKRSLVSVRNKNGHKAFYVHRLVLLTFIPSNEPLLTVDHINRDPFDNRLENLRWASPKEQAENRKNYRRVNIRKLSMVELDIIYEKLKKDSLSNVAKEFNMLKNSLYNVMRYMHPNY